MESKTLNRVSLLRAGAIGVIAITGTTDITGTADIIGAPAITGTTDITGTPAITGATRIGVMDIGSSLSRLTPTLRDPIGGLDIAITPRIPIRATATIRDTTIRAITTRVCASALVSGDIMAGGGKVTLEGKARVTRARAFPL